jgi:conjugative transfer pilus assembly protein TraH
MSTGTDPALSMGPRRGTLSGGRFSMRTRTVRPGPLINFDPPSLNAGCGGIDLYGGSFSAISAEQFKNLGRAVASQAAGYAFELGLSAICDTCADKMARLGDVVRSLNFQMMDSCQIAQGIVTGDRDGALRARAGEWRASFQRLQSGSRDVFSSQGHADSSNNTPSQEVADAADAAVQAKVFGGNAMWEVLKAGQADQLLVGLFTSSSDKEAFYEDLISLTGTVVSCSPGSDDCPVPEPESEDGATLDYRPYPPRMSLRDLVYGSEDGQSVPYYDCSGGLNGPCLKIEPKQRAIVGLGTRLVRMAVGEPGDPSTGFVRKFRDNAGAPTETEQAVMAAGGEFTTYLMRFTKSNDLVAEKFAREFGPQLAADVLLRHFGSVLIEAEGLVARSNNPHRDQLLELLDEAGQRLRDDHAAITSVGGGKAQQLAYFELLDERAQQGRSRLGAAETVQR